MTSFDEGRTIDHLGAQFRKGLPVLFTGAGFSLEAQDGEGRPLPLGQELAEELWPIGFPDEPFDSRSHLQDIFQRCLRIDPNRLQRYLMRRLTAVTVPDFFETYFSAAWKRAYSVNVDDLPLAVARRFSLPRPISMISGLKWEAASITKRGESHLDVLALHGLLEDLPSGVTFSRGQYSERATAQDPFYAQISADLLSHPTVFVGSSLEEPLLWEHIEIRRLRGDRRNSRELRPRSYLVSPSLDRAKEQLLAEFNVAWLRMSAREFAEQILVKLKSEMQEGLARLAADVRNRRSAQISTVGELQSVPSDSKSVFLLGQEPSWSDIRSGTAIKRSVDEDLLIYCTEELKVSGLRAPLLLSGTAGSGKSTSLMRLALKLTAERIEVGWIDRDSNLRPYEIIELMRAPDSPKVLAIDDADLFGTGLAGLVRDLATMEPSPLILLAIRSNKVDRCLNEDRLGAVRPKEISMPHLTDDDIDGLIETLDSSGLLGILQNKNHDEQRAAFRVKAGRQLLVAMYEATSGKRFEEKVSDEFDELSGVSRDLYAHIAVATHLQYSLPQDELLLALGNPSNTVLNELHLLETRSLVVRAYPSGRFKSRHRMIATVVVEHMQQGTSLSGVMTDLAWAAATRVSPELHRQDHQWRFLKRLTSHERLFKLTSVDEARNLYATCEDLLKWDSHFWLQRGSLEVEEGNLELAGNYLSQARALQPDDPYVLTEYAYYLLRRACEHPDSGSAADEAKEAIQILWARIAVAGKVDYYPFHVLGAQGLSWARRGRHTREERRALLSMLREVVSDGVSKHPLKHELKSLLQDLTKEELKTAVRKPGKPRK